jgi:hypothetical protein
VSSLVPGPIPCPSCGHEAARHPWLVTKRVRDLSCPRCGAQLEVTIPAWPHYLTAFVLAVVGELAALALLLAFLFRMWWGPPLAVVVITGIELARSAWLRSRAEVRWVNRNSMERRASGAWVPE